MSELWGVFPNLKGIARRLRRVYYKLKSNLPPLTNTEFWTNYNVTLHHEFASRDESLAYLDWRNSQYLFYDELMPLSGHDGQTVLDYGCGPGHDLVGFVEFSKPKRVIGVDISSTALEQAKRRLSLHHSDVVEFRLIQDGQPHLPFDDSQFDYIHSSGVLHHTPNIQEILREFFRILSPSGSVRVMVYNYDSIWLHLYVAYQRRIVDKIDSGVSLEEAFKRSTDNIRTPISRWYKPEEFWRLCADCGFSGKYLGAAIHVQEMALLPLRYPAIQNRALPKEHRDFLRGLTFDHYGRPLWKGHVAGIDGVYELVKS